MLNPVFRGATIGLVAAFALSGCFGSDPEPKPASGAVKDVAKVVEELDRATRAADYELVCRDLFTAAARERAGGSGCARLLREASEDVRGPTIKLLEITIQKDRAEARVRTRAKGQAPVEETVVLVRESGEWRVESLAAG